MMNDERWLTKNCSVYKLVVFINYYKNTVFTYLFVFVRVFRILEKREQLEHN